MSEFGRNIRSVKYFSKVSPFSPFSL